MGKSILVIGCKECERKLKENMSSPVQYKTGYYIEDLLTLFKEHYNCIFCGETLEITPRIAHMITVFMDRHFHVTTSSVIPGVVQFSGFDMSFTIPTDEHIPSLEEYFASKGIYIENANLPLEREIEILQKGFKEFDHTKWSLTIESGHNDEPFLPDNKAWFSLF